MLFSMWRLNVKRRYTLIELLVVLAITVILVSLLFQAMSYGRHTVKIQSCAENLRTMTSLLYEHATDNGGRFPSLTGSRSWDDAFSERDGRRWSDDLLNSSVIWEGTLEENPELIEQTDIYRCPEDDVLYRDRLKRTYVSNMLRYTNRTTRTVNSRWAGIMEFAPNDSEFVGKSANISRLTDPSMAIAFTEKVKWENYIGNRMCMMSIQDLYKKQANLEMDFWGHARGSKQFYLNFAFNDGHVAFLDEQQTRMRGDEEADFRATDTMWDCYK